MKVVNKNALAVQLALIFVQEYREMFEKWVKEKYGADFETVLKR